MNLPAPPPMPSLPPVPARGAAPVVEAPNIDPLSPEGRRLRRQRRQEADPRPTLPQPDTRPSVEWGTAPKLASSKKVATREVPADWMTGPQVQERLGVSQPAVSALAKKGAIMGQKIAGRWRLDPASVERYAEARRQN
jgi:hypothetical protein